MSETETVSGAPAAQAIPLINPPMKTMRLADGRALTWQEFGDPNGRPSLYFHGGGSISEEAGIFHREAVANKVRLISTNRPGAGGTSLKHGRPVAAYSDDLRELLDHLSVDKCTCFGESNGGMVTLAVAATMSDRILGAAPINPTIPWRDKVAREVSCSMAALPYTMMRYAPWLITASVGKGMTNKYREQKAKARSNDGPPASFLDLVGPPPGTEEDVGEILWSIMAQQNADILRPELKWAAADWGFDYYNIPVPLEFFCGVRDPQAPFALVLADANPRARFHYFAYGHTGFAHPKARRMIMDAIAAFY